MFDPTWAALCTRVHKNIHQRVYVFYYFSNIYGVRQTADSGRPGYNNNRLIITEMSARAFIPTNVLQSCAVASAGLLKRFDSVIAVKTHTRTKYIILYNNNTILLYCISCSFVCGRGWRARLYTTYISIYTLVGIISLYTFR